ncbi:MAG TPA: ferritin-like domain-containing protein [Chthoniobacterales bacterium]
MKQLGVETGSSRRSFFKKSALATGAAMVGAGLFGASKSAFGQNSGGSLTKGDIDILRFAATAELIESDLWTQYAQLGGLTPGQVPPEVNPNQPLNAYQAALGNLDGDAQQYISSNTNDEISHANFLNAYLESKGAEAVNLDQFRTLPGSQATPVSGSGGPFLTNLMHLNVDTSWYIRYRSATNPDFGATFPQAITINNKTTIPRTNADFTNPKLIQVIANTAAFHFAAIEQGGSSLYPTLAQKVSSLEVLKIMLGIGGDEVAHFLEWVDFAGNGVQPPVAPVSAEGLTFPNFFVNPGTPLFQPNLIFPVPCEFISASLPECAVIRPSNDNDAGAQAAIASFTSSGLFEGQSAQFLEVVNKIAKAADAAKREV